MSAPRFKKTGPRGFSLEFYSATLNQWLCAGRPHYHDLGDATKAAIDRTKRNSVYKFRAVVRAR